MNALLPAFQTDGVYSTSEMASRIAAEIGFGFIGLDAWVHRKIDTDASMPVTRVRPRWLGARAEKVAFDAWLSKNRDLIRAEILALHEALPEQRAAALALRANPAPSPVKPRTSRIKGR